MGKEDTHMSKLYTNQKANTSVLSGKIKSISEDRKNIEVAYKNYDYNAQKSTDMVANVVSGVAVDESYVAGKNITVIGYTTGPTFTAINISNKENIFETQGLTVISGYVAKAGLNEEKNEDGSPKLKQDGTPRKPHFDIQVVIEENGNPTHHFVKVYNAPKHQKAGEKSNIEKQQARFVDFKDPETTPTRVTIATQSGQPFTFEKSDGTVYYGCSHMSVNSLDIEYEYQRQRKNTQTQTVQTPAQPAPQTPAPQPQPTPEVMPSQVQESEVDGYDAEIDFN